MSDPRQQIPETDQIDLRKGLIVAAAVCALLVVLMACRYWFNILVIDIFILRDFDSARQQFKDFLDFLFPCRRVRRRDDVAQEEQRPANEEGIEVEIGTSSFGGMLSSLSPVERESVLESMLVKKTITEDDLAHWRERHHHDTDASDVQIQEGIVQNSIDAHDMTCSICLHDLGVGDEVVAIRSCEHIFHYACIIQWAQTNGACPYCRTDIFVLEAKEDGTNNAGTE